MRNTSAGLLVVVLLLALQGYAKAPSIPALVLQARYVALGYETAEGFIAESDFQSFANLKVEPDDRQALANIYDALNKWKRYIVTINPADADILFAVRTGRRASGVGGVRVGTGGIDQYGKAQTGGNWSGVWSGSRSGR